MLDLRDTRTGGLPLAAGVVNGALAFVASFLGTFVLYSLLGLKPLVGFVMRLGGGVPFEQMVGFVFYGGHFVVTATGDGSTNFALALASGGVLYVVLVVGVLAGTGYYLASVDWVGTPPLGFVVGATQVLGYVPLATAGATVFEFSRTSQSVLQQTALSMHVPVLEAALLAGIVVPAVAGGLGGAVAGWRD